MGAITPLYIQHTPPPPPITQDTDTHLREPEVHPLLPPCAAGDARGEQGQAQNPVGGIEPVRCFFGVCVYVCVGNGTVG